jgi:hypothetical protein
VQMVKAKHHRRNYELHLTEANLTLLVAVCKWKCRGAEQMRGGRPARHPSTHRFGLPSEGVLSSCARGVAEAATRRSSIYPPRVPNAATKCSHTNCCTLTVSAYAARDGHVERRPDEVLRHRRKAVWTSIRADGQEYLSRSSDAGNEGLLRDVSRQEHGAFFP